VNEEILQSPNLFGLSEGNVNRSLSLGYDFSLSQQIKIVGDKMGGEISYLGMEPITPPSFL
jgi:hypothetical protein